MTDRFDPQTALYFRRLATITIFAIYLLILVGGIVRASGAGMGCPDWPTCFGQWIPPTDEAQLPANYHQLYADRGYKDTQFNAFKTWTEYVNRLCGVAIGILIFMTAVASRTYRKTDNTVFYLSLTAFFLVGFQGWLGSTVVASNLKPVIITLHMLLAWFLVSLLIYTALRSQRNFIATLDSNDLPAKFNTVLMVAMAILLLQVAMGTQIRQAVDVLANTKDSTGQLVAMDRAYWRESFPIVFYVHRSFSSLILFTNSWLVWQLYRTYRGRVMFLQRSSLALMVCIITAILAGVSLDRLGMPAVAQPLHLLMANLIFGAQFSVLMYLRYATRKSGSGK
ncbi:COX15/CtaA family protein [Crenothrix polyspora]|uniref:Cytochrome oxidase assembly n=1 Tax=Crenothrix polyspora TaxID=360316 RepID=A0A1R4HD70_9GAMM|nr:COX15/CtaA family protein [Crenothrix polyspora]SJM94166.1 Cytochrome oxidase assembly [Crenothrix polyspora]